MAWNITKSAQHILAQLVLDAGVTSVDVYEAVAVDFPSLTAGLLDTVDVTVTGVAIGDLVLGVVTADGTAPSVDVAIVASYVTAADTVRIHVFNSTAGTLDAASETYDFIVLDRT